MEGPPALRLVNEVPETSELMERERGLQIVRADKGPAEADVRFYVIRLFPDGRAKIARRLRIVPLLQEQVAQQVVGRFVGRIEVNRGLQMKRHPAREPNGLRELPAGLPGYAPRGSRIASVLMRLDKKQEHLFVRMGTPARS